MKTLTRMTWRFRISSAPVAPLPDSKQTLSLMYIFETPYGQKILHNIPDLIFINTLFKKIYNKIAINKQ